ncbi:MerR family transcriptional regulator [Crossiella cryophila]|uniref:DNA-binding transcriptional MerR regulator n=1 Tax=Crossiella cryophila TaxID=43355 RepID=A0A7W7C5M2_9PSEU|nr:MerR family transcriptional regulator [Crossiella cryophila]MBB4674942.1 DNA-binding transcriptional MerR regulator [Crossiella cryophila]
MNGETKRWSVGELARATGLTVRTLHHYDQIGLVQPSERTSAGHRRYIAADLQRLYRVRALRSFGLSLEDVGIALQGAAADPEVLREVLHTQLGQLDSQVRAAQRLRDQVRSLLEQLDGSASPDAAEFLQLLESMTMIENYYTKEQLDQLSRRREEFGEEAIKEVENEWPRLFAEVDDLMAEGAAPTDERAVRVVERMDELIFAFHGGDEGIKAAVEKMWAEQGEQLREQQCGPSAEVNAFLAAVRAARG